MSPSKPGRNSTTGAIHAGSGSVAVISINVHHVVAIKCECIVIRILVWYLYLGLLENGTPRGAVLFRWSSLFIPTASRMSFGEFDSHPRLPQGILRYETIYNSTQTQIFSLDVEKD